MVKKEKEEKFDNDNRVGGMRSLEEFEVMAEGLERVMGLLGGRIKVIGEGVEVEGLGEAMMKTYDGSGWWRRQSADYNDEIQVEEWCWERIGQWVHGLEMVLHGQ